MTSRDHLLGHAPAAQFNGPDEWGSFYPLGIPRRIEDGFEAVNYGGLKPQTLAALLPTGTVACTARDRMGIENRFDIRNARLQALAPPPKVAEQLTMFNEAMGVTLDARGYTVSAGPPNLHINHDPAVLGADYTTTTIQRNGLVIEQIVKAGAGQAWGD